MALLVAGCGLRVTNERPAYDELNAAEKAAVDLILLELGGFNTQVKKRTKFNIDQVMDKEAINVSFKDKIFAYNMGNDVVHISLWENLSEAQRGIVKGWFQSASAADAASVYSPFFYRFLAVAQGVKQFMFNALTPGWVFGSRTLFNIERDSFRVAFSHFDTIGRKVKYKVKGKDVEVSMAAFMTAACKPMRTQYDATWGYLFATGVSTKVAKDYLRENFAELANPKDPTGYVYFMCRWLEMAIQDASSLTVELEWLIDLPNP